MVFPIIVIVIAGFRLLLCDPLLVETNLIALPGIGQKHRIAWHEHVVHAIIHRKPLHGAKLLLLLGIEAVQMRIYVFFVTDRVNAEYSQHIGQRHGRVFQRQVVVKRGDVSVLIQIRHDVVVVFQRVLRRPLVCALQIVQSGCLALSDTFIPVLVPDHYVIVVGCAVIDDVFLLIADKGACFLGHADHIL